MTKSKQKNFGKKMSLDEFNDTIPSTPIAAHANDRNEFYEIMDRYVHAQLPDHAELESFENILRRNTLYLDNIRNTRIAKAPKKIHLLMKILQSKNFQLHSFITKQAYTKKMCNVKEAFFTIRKQGKAMVLDFRSKFQLDEDYYRGVYTMFCQPGGHEFKDDFFASGEGDIYVEFYSRDGDYYPEESVIALIEDFFDCN